MAGHQRPATLEGLSRAHPSMASGTHCDGTRLAPMNRATRHSRFSKVDGILGLDLFPVTCR